MTDVCTDVCIEPELWPVTDENLAGASANCQDGARLDAANSFWGEVLKELALMSGFLTLIPRQTEVPQSLPATESMTALKKTCLRTMSSRN